MGEIVNYDCSSGEKVVQGGQGYEEKMAKFLPMTDPDPINGRK
jgi:hypothetical protein